jgi:uncharacterized protein YbjT (DUF2867 family)
MGGTGTVGGHLLRELSGDRERMDIVAAARSETSAERLRTAGFATVTLDLDRNETLAPAMHGVDTVFMLKPYSIDYLIQSKRAIDAAVKARVRHAVNRAPTVQTTRRGRRSAGTGSSRPTFGSPASSTRRCDRISSWTT